MFSVIVNNIKQIFIEFPKFYDYLNTIEQLNSKKYMKCAI